MFEGVCDHFSAVKLLFVKCDEEEKQTRKQQKLGFSGLFRRSTTDCKCTQKDKSVQILLKESKCQLRPNRKTAVLLSEETDRSAEQTLQHSDLQTDH